MNTAGSLSVQYDNASTIYRKEDLNLTTGFSREDFGPNVTDEKAFKADNISVEAAASYALTYPTVPSFQLDDLFINFSTTTAQAMAFSDTSFSGTQVWNGQSESTTGNLTNATFSPRDCELMLEEFEQEKQLVFDYTQLVRVSVTWSVFLLSAIGNFFVLSSVTFRRRRRHISHSQLIMMHLSIANLAFTFFILPVDAIWNITMQWKGGDVLCRLMNVLKQFAMYISSAIIVVMGVDRVAILMVPMSTAGQRQRIRTMLIVAWVFSLLNAIPAGVIFSVMKYAPNPKFCVEYVVTQCVDLEVQGKANLEGYYVYTMFISFFGPLVCILVCYLFIAVSISRMARISKEAHMRCSMKNRGSGKSVTRRSLDRARRVSQIVTGLITATFILCWGPYYVVGLVHWFDKTSNAGSVQQKPRISSMAQVVMLMSMYLNPCLHPLITVLLVKEVRSNILAQCKKSPNTGRLPPRKVSCRKKKSIVKSDKNGTKEELLLHERNGRDFQNHQL